MMIRMRIRRVSLTLSLGDLGGLTSGALSQSPFSDKSAMHPRTHLSFSFSLSLSLSLSVYIYICIYIYIATCRKLPCYEFSKSGPDRGVWAIYISIYMCLVLTRSP